MSTLSIVVLAAALGAAPQGEAQTLEQVRGTIRRGIPFIEEKGQWWIEEKKCVSCHRVSMMVWSLGAARQRGFSVSERLEEWFEWTITSSLAKNEKGKVVGAGNKAGLAQLLLARHLAAGGSDRADSYRKFENIIIGDLQPDGSWKPGGQLPSQKRPKSETTNVTTTWIVLALANQNPQNGRPAELDRAVKYIEASPPGKSTEWYVARLLLARRLGDEATTSSIVKCLRSQQQADGGWGWIVGEKSDGLATGMSVYALLRAGVALDDAMIKRAQRFLIDTQCDDGSWKVRGTKANEKDRIEETAVYWGTTWAVIGLVESLPN